MTRWRQRQGDDNDKVMTTTRWRRRRGNDDKEVGAGGAAGGAAAVVKDNNEVDYLVPVLTSTIAYKEFKKWESHYGFKK